MQFTPTQARALLLAVVVASSPVFTQEQPPLADDHATGANAGAGMPSRAPAVLTGKERLGEKWKDEQRTDNCKVPIEKRGAKPRPDICRHVFQDGFDP
jgi:hypothetical protein